jgi:hypothetical protein
MSKDDSLRLRDRRDAPPELLRALEALRQGADETSRLERVAAKLGPLLDAPAPTPATGASSLPFKRVALKLIVGGLALLAPALWLLRPEQADKSPVPERQLESAVGETTRPQPEPAAPADAAPDTGARAQLDPATDPRRSAAKNGRAQRRGDGRRAAASNPSAANAELGTDLPRGPDSPGSLSPQPSAATQAAVSANAKPATPQPSAADATAAVSGGSSLSEAELLFEARKAMQARPSLALRLLQEHAQRYPQGQLVPEREVLVIEALRGLGRSAEADARSQRFKARYPDSFHRQRLQR